ncbi:hypothetical protein POTOM_049751 [Populus tomentosa]|uniref:Uncharacterized protein n=1 Tax=Populus tomentosa TaxID=118781 RepID=A0A8X8C9E6_POPTO|nr:hypothetical protein POTOM_049751 [Populus tomentosa]
MSFLSKSSSQGDCKGSKAPPSKHVSKGAEGTGSSFPGFPSKMKNPFAKRTKCFLSGIETLGNENGLISNLIGTALIRTLTLCFIKGSVFSSFSSKIEKLLSLFDIKNISANINSSKASSDSQQPSPNNENPETDTEPALSQHVSKGAEGTGSSFPGFSSKMKNPFKKRSEG